jgi:hypothetical protein
MKLCLKILAVVIVAATMVSLIGCAAPATFNYSNVTLSLTYTPCAANCPAIYYNPASPTTMITPGPLNSGCVNIFATVTNAPANITYTLYPTPSLVIPTLPSGTSTTIGTGSGQINPQTSPVGTVNYANGTTNFYCAPGAAVPVYKGAALEQAQALGIPQGDVLMVAGVPNNPNTPSSSCVLPNSPGCAIFTQLFQMYNSSGATGPPTVVLFPANATGTTNSILTVTHGGNSYQFNGFAVGAPPCLNVTACLINGTPYPLLSTDNKVIWLVGQTTATAVVGGNATYGTISTAGLYTSPTAVPPSQPVIVLQSDLVSTITAVAYITIN